MQMVVRINGIAQTPEKPAQTVKEACGNDGVMWLHSAGASGIGTLLKEYVEISEYLAAAVLMFAGTMWLFGHRTKAIEMLIGVVVGYEIILHAWDFVHWLKTLKG